MADSVRHAPMKRRGLPHLLLGALLHVEAVFFALALPPEGFFLTIPFFLAGLILWFLWARDNGPRLRRKSAKVARSRMLRELES